MNVLEVIGGWQMKAPAKKATAKTEKLVEPGTTQQ
jgi:hypothetical protein